MKERMVVSALLAVALAGPAFAQSDGFQREGSGAKRAVKDALEGKAPPKLVVANWKNTEKDRPLAWKDLRGKVVVLDFWGVW